MKPSLIYFHMDVAQRVALLSHAQKLKVGAIAVQDGRIVGEGVNGTPVGWKDNICEDKIYEFQENSKDFEYLYVDKQGKYRLKTRDVVVHAEANCILKMAKHGQPTKGVVMFCNIAPCVECAKMIAMAEFKKVYYLNEYKTNNGINLLKDCGVLVQKVIYE